MCDYCEKLKSTSFETVTKEKVELMKSMDIFDDFSNEQIPKDVGNPVQYIRKYIKGNIVKFCLVTEFADENGIVIVNDISFCPKCGRQLIDTYEDKN